MSYFRFELKIKTTMQNIYYVVDRTNEQHQRDISRIMGSSTENTTQSKVGKRIISISLWCKNERIHDSAYLFDRYHLHILFNDEYAKRKDDLDGDVYFHTDMKTCDIIREMVFYKRRLFYIDLENNKTDTIGRGELFDYKFRRCYFASSRHELSKFSKECLERIKTQLKNLIEKTEKELNNYKEQLRRYETI